MFMFLAHYSLETAHIGVNREYVRVSADIIDDKMFSYYIMRIRKHALWAFESRLYLVSFSAWVDMDKKKQTHSNSDSEAIKN